MRNFFKGISFSSIAAGALAAVTSFLLSAKIGIAGSVIGVAIGSVVSAVSTQIYKNVLSESGKKLQNVTTGANDSGNGSHSEPAEDSRLGAGPVGLSASGTVPLPAIPAPPDDPEATVVGLHGTARKPRTAGSASAQSLLDARNDSTHANGMHPADNAHGVRSVSGRSGRKDAAILGKKTAGGGERTKRLAIIVAVVSALAAVGLTAAIIMLVTQGQGTDTVVRDWVNQSNTPSRQEQYPHTGTTKNDNSNDSEPTDTGNGTSDNDSTDSNGTGEASSDGTSGNGSDSNSSSEGTGSSDSSSSGNSSSNSESGSSNGDGSSESGSSSSNNGSGSSDSNGSNGSTNNGSGSGSNSSNGSNGSGSSSEGSNGNGSSSGSSSGSTSGGGSGGIGGSDAAEGK